MSAFTFTQLAALCVNPRIEAKLIVNCEQWTLTAKLGDELEIRIPGFRTEPLDYATASYWDMTYDVSVEEAVALITGQVNPRTWADSMEEAARLLAEAQEYAEQLGVERSA